MTVEAVRRPRGHWKRADEIHKGQLIQRRAAWALAGFPLRRFPLSLIGIEVNRLVLTR